MVCDICHKNVATVHLTEIINSKVVELHLCPTCAREKTEELKEQLSISDFLSGLVGPQMEKEKKALVKPCPFCGLTYAVFKKIGRLGCSRCYVTFRPQLLPLLKRIHGSTQHLGKIPRSISKKSMANGRVKELKERLARAIQLEEYEEAVSLRDEIKKLEGTKDV